MGRVASQMAAFDPVDAKGRVTNEKRVFDGWRFRFGAMRYPSFDRDLSQKSDFEKTDYPVRS